MADPRKHGNNIVRFLSSQSNLPEWLFELKEEDPRSYQPRWCCCRPLLDELEIDFSLVARKVVWLLWEWSPRRRSSTPDLSLTRGSVILSSDGDFWGAATSVLALTIAMGSIRILPWVFGIWFFGSGFLCMVCCALESEVRLK
jgi:hypothetical protein